MDALPSRVRAFVMGSAAKQDGGYLFKPFYATLTIDGWLIELARTHGRSFLGSWTHEEFAAWLGMRGEELGGAYRKMLKLADQDREELIQIARRILGLTDLGMLPALQKCVEMSRFRRARENVERRASNMGRPRQSVDTVGPMGKQLEKWRLALRLSVTDWAAGLGITEPTYRSRVSKERDASYRAKMEQLMKDGAQRYASLCAPIVARHPVVATFELRAAYEIVGADLARLRDELLAENPLDQTSMIANDGAGSDDFLPLDLYSWLPATRRPDEEEKEPA